jgi:SWI/SNF-related matrix-associated actin-dependent regulator 1 of chromatin subfamily A
MLQDAFEALNGYNNLEFDLDKATRGSRNAHASDLLKYLTNAEDVLVVNNNAAAVLLMLAALARGRKVVVAAHHRDIVDEVANRHGGLKIQGGMSVKEVEAVKARFQEASAAEAPVLVLSIQAAKTGHTLTAAQEILFLEQPWTPADVSQTYSRLHRIGQQGSVTATYMLAAGTVDEDIYDLIEEKRSVVDQATEGTSGAEDGTAPGLALRIIGGLLSDEM